MEDNDAQLQLKKRARRRLVGAVVFASIVAVVLPIIMDHKPRPTVQDVEIRIPGQDEKAFAPKFAIAPIEKPPADAPDSVPAAEKAPAAATAASAPPAEKPVQAKVVEKPAEKPVAKPEKPAEKPAAKEPADAKRAAAILAGQGAAADTPPAKAGEYVILIGAFASEENVKNIKSKLAERNIRTYTEPLDTPGGKRTRVRAGPFPSREAAEKALEKMKQVGVSGVISGR
jgi:DedD protein